MDEWVVANACVKGVGGVLEMAAGLLVEFEGTPDAAG